MKAFIHPLTILSTLPSAAIGALLALMMPATISPSSPSSHHPLDRIVRRTRIMISNFAPPMPNGTNGKSPREAIYQAASCAFRPILMDGDGRGSRRPCR